MCKLSDHEGSHRSGSAKQWVAVIQKAELCGETWMAGAHGRRSVPALMPAVPPTTGMEQSELPLHPSGMCTLCWIRPCTQNLSPLSMQDRPERTTAGLPIAGTMPSETPAPPSGASARPLAPLCGPRSLRGAPRCAPAPRRAGAPAQPHGTWPSQSLPTGLCSPLRAVGQATSRCEEYLKAIIFLLAIR